MKRIDEIKTKRQAQHIFNRMKKGKEIQKQKDIREVERDLALIRSPAAGLKKAAKDMEVEEDFEDVMGDDDLTGLDVGAIKAKKQVAKIVEEIHESDHEMEENL